MELLFQLFLASQVASAPAPQAPLAVPTKQVRAERSYFKGIVVDEGDKDILGPKVPVASYRVALK